jgi:hypothetical protein
LVLLRNRDLLLLTDTIDYKHRHMLPDMVDILFCDRYDLLASPDVDKEDVLNRIIFVSFQ